MKSLTRFLAMALLLVPFGGAHAVVATTAGSNLTAYNGASGARDNNNWNSLMNSRTTPAAADFGNCNALILRCAQPKCAGCTSMDVARPIVSGCVQSNASCKQYGDDLIEYISAQLVSGAAARANEQAAAMQNAAAQNAAAQSAAQIQQMQQQMQQMQSQMAAQNAETVAQLQSALAAQQQQTAQAIADAAAQNAAAAATVADPNAVLTIDGLSATQSAAAMRGVSDDVLAREQVAGQILSSIENAEVSLKTLNATMQNVFQYARCDTRGNDCLGPKRVKVFKQRALEFFDPYETILDELYDALVLAQSVGVDITDIYMMLNGSCNVWGQYVCTCTGNLGRYSTDNCPNGKSIAYSAVGHKSNGEAIYGGATRGGHECVYGQAIPVEDSPSCTLVKTLTDAEADTVRREWLEPETGDDTMIRIGCASAALETSAFFSGRKKQANIDIDILRNIIAQDAPQTYGTRFGTSSKPNPDGIKYCNVGPNMYQDLEKIVNLKSLPTQICVPDGRLIQILDNEGMLVSGDTGTAYVDSIARQCHEWDKLFPLAGGDKTYASYAQCTCDRAGATWKEGKCICDKDETWDNTDFRCVGGGKK